MNKEVAIIMIGQIRLNSEKQKERWEEIKKELKDYDVYISTYDNYKSKAKELSKNIFTLADQSINSCEYLNLPKSNIINDVNVRKGFNHLWQHILLRGLVEKYHKKLSDYKYIIKIRNDQKFNVTSILDRMKNNSSFIYSNSDYIFGCSSNIFLNMFFYNNFIDYIKKVWNKDKDYITLNYNNLLKSKGGLKFGWINYENIEDLTKESLHNLCLKKSTEDQPNVKNFKIIKSSSIKTSKYFSTCFASEKQIAIYFLFFAPVRWVFMQLIR
jgi:hypothetical protein